MGYHFAVIGGDARLRYTAQELQRIGCNVARYAVSGLADTHKTVGEAVAAADAVILPMPAFGSDGSVRNEENQMIAAEEIATHLRKGAVVYLGKLDTHAKPLQAQADVCDYAAWESLAIENAVPTAEGAIQIAMEQLPKTIQGSRFLVIGAGRIGMCLARKLTALGADVVVSARKEADFARIRAAGLTADITGKYGLGLGVYDCVMNTVPAKVMDCAQLEALTADCLLIELASAPFGFDREECRLVGRKWISGAALPGKVAPKTAGELIAAQILAHWKGVQA